jgi:hypothetical protein
MLLVLAGVLVRLGLGEGVGVDNKAAVFAFSNVSA